MNTNQPISAAQAAALLLALLPELARAETYPQWSDGTGETVRTTRVTAYDDDNRIIELMPVQRSMALDTLLHVEGGDWDRPQTFSVAGESLFLTYPVVAVAPLWLSPAAEDSCTHGPCDLSRLVERCPVCHMHRNIASDAGALLEQRHQVEDPAEPPVGGAEPDVARDCARSLAAGLMGLPDWGDGCEPVFVERGTDDVPVVGEAL